MGAAAPTLNQEGITMDMINNEATKLQKDALVRVFERHVRDSDHGDFKNLGFIDWVERDVHPAFSDCIMVAVPNMMLGIEPDGYTHS
jgi:hypothetical protein